MKPKGKCNLGHPLKYYKGNMSYCPDCRKIRLEKLKEEELKNKFNGPNYFDWD